MLPHHQSETISGDDFQAILRSYPLEIPEKLAELEQQRLVIIPRVLSERDPAYLTKVEVQTLVDWKLAHGTFRPSLRKLVASNLEQTVEETTKAAYALYGKDHDAWDKAISTLSQLRGVGPATASLLLSVYDSKNIPFFSDELFRWVMFTEAKGRGWDRKMKYSLGEYKQMLPLVQSLKERLGNSGAGGSEEVTALDAEKVAYVLGRRAAGESESSRAGTKRAAQSAPPSDTINKEETSSDAKQPLPATPKKRRLRSSAYE